MSYKKDDSERILLIRMGSLGHRKIKHPYHCHPPYTLKYIESLLYKEKRFQARLLDCVADPVTKDKLLAYTLEWSPRLIIISANIFTFKDAFEYAALVKRNKNIITIATGQIMKVCLEGNDLMQPPFDAVLPGEAEKEIFSLIERLCSGSDRGAELRRVESYKKREENPVLVDDLDALPFPVYSMSEMRKYGFLYPVRLNREAVWGHVLSSRGCPYDCIFCSPISRISFGKKLRLRSAVNIADEISVQKKLGVNIISFDDDNFTICSSHVEAVCQEIRKRHLGIKWIAHARIDNVTQPLLELMKESGCILLRFGIESGSIRVIDMLKKKKSDIDWIETARAAFKSSKRAGISTAALFIIGSPSESQSEIEKSLELAKELEPDFIQVHFFTPYFGSAAYEQYKSKIEKKELLFEMHHYIAPSINLSSIDHKVLRKSQASFYRKFLLRPKFLINHLFKYLFFYLNNLRILFRLLKVVFLH